MQPRRTSAARLAAQAIDVIKDELRDALRAARQCAAIPYRTRNGALEVLLVTRRSGDGWIVPKGGIGIGRSARVAAAVEAFEEAGVEGRMSSSPVGTFLHTKRGEVVAVEAYDLEVADELDEWPERDERDRRWHSLRAAAAAVDEPSLRALILALPSRVARRAR